MKVVEGHPADLLNQWPLLIDTDSVRSLGVFKVNPQAGGKLHQVGKPLALMEDLVAACGPRILDPFMGSTTTGMAALKQGKHFTGIEGSRHYFEVALQRLGSAPPPGIINATRLCGPWARVLMIFSANRSTETSWGS